MLSLNRHIDFVSACDKAALLLGFDSKREWCDAYDVVFYMYPIRFPHSMFSEF